MKLDGALRPRGGGSGKGNQKTGLLRVANEIAGGVRVERDVGRPVPSSGAPQALNEVAQAFAGNAAKISALADHAAAVEGAEAGRIAGLDPEFRPSRQQTIRGEAYDRAGLEVAGAQLRQAIEADFDGEFMRLQGSPAELEQSLTAKAGIYLRQAPEELRPDLQILMRGKKLGYMRELARVQAARTAAEQKAALETDVSEGLKGIHQRAFALGLDAEADGILARDIKQLEGALGRTGIDGAPLVNPSAAAKVLAGAKETVTTARLMGAFSRLPSLEAKQQFIEDLKEDFGNSKGLAKEYDLAGFDRVVGSLEADLRSARTEASAAQRAVASDVTDVARMAEKGFAPSEAELSALKGRVAALGGNEKSAEIAQQMQEAEQLIGWQKSARLATPAELDQFTRAERARIAREGADTFSVQRLELAEKLTDTMRTELKQDPLGWADRAALMRVAPLDFSSPDAAAVTLKARIAQAEEVAARYGQEAQYLRPDEKRSLAVAAAQGGGDLIQVASTISQAAGEAGPKILGELFDEAPAVATLGGHVANVGVTVAAHDAADGIALQKTEGFKPLAPSAKEARLQATEELGGALRALPKSEGALIALANAAYETRARRKGLSDFDADLWRQGLRELVGQREIGGETYGGIAYQGGTFSGTDPVVIPANVRQDGFSELLETIRLDDLTAPLGAPLYGDGRPARLADLRRGTLVSVGDGRYWVALGDVETDPQWLMTGRGEEWVLDLKALEPTLRQRRPDLYLGAR